MAERTPYDRRRRLVCAALLSSPLLARAALSDTIVRIKPSIVIVGTNMRSRAPSFELKGSGFVIGDGTLVATNAHVASVPLDADRFETLAVIASVTAVSNCARRVSSPRARRMIWRS